MVRNTLFEVVNLKVEALGCMRVFNKCVQSKRKRPRAKEFKLDPTESEEPIKYFKQVHEATSGTLRTRRVAEKSSKDRCLQGTKDFMGVAR